MRKSTPVESEISERIEAEDARRHPADGLCALQRMTTKQHQTICVQKRVRIISLRSKKYRLALRRSDAIGTSNSSFDFRRRIWHLMLLAQVAGLHRAVPSTSLDKPYSVWREHYILCPFLCQVFFIFSLTLLNIYYPLFLYLLWKMWYNRKVL